MDRQILIVTEKPSAAGSIAAALGISQKKKGYFEGGGYIVAWCIGHLVVPVPPERYGEQWKKWSRESLPLLPEHWKYKVKKETEGQYKILEKLFCGASEIVNACDAGREGELIFRLAYEMAGCTKPVRRLWLSSMEENAIRKGLADAAPSSRYDSLYQSALCRQRADWLVGINGTRLFTTLYGGRILKVGRVQTPVLAMVAGREKEIAGFKRTPYYTVHIFCSGMDAVSGRMEKEDAEALAEACQDGKAVVDSLESGDKALAPPKLYDLTSLQRDADRMFGLTAKQTLECLQRLYEKKLATYPRTDSRYLTDDMEQAAGRSAEAAKRAFSDIFAQTGTDAALDMPALLDSRKVSDHHALIPTCEAGKADIRALPENERKILALVSCRLLCAAGGKHLYRTSRAGLSCGGQAFMVSGRTVVENGWKDYEDAFRQFYKIRNEKDPGSLEESAPLPPLAEGQEFDVVRVEVKEHYTQPPKRFTDGSLLAAMERAGSGSMADGVERRGLGTPATRADVIEKLAADGFIRREKKQLVPTEEGMQLAGILPDAVKSPELTAEWENSLALVAEGKMDADDFMGGIEEMVSGLVRSYGNAGVDAAAKELFAAKRTVLGVCPKCGGQVVKGKYGAYCAEKCGMGIAKYYSTPFTDSQVKSFLDGKKILMKGLEGRDGKPYDLFLEPAGIEGYSYEKDGKQFHGFRFAFKKSSPAKKRETGMKTGRERLRKGKFMGKRSGIQNRAAAVFLAAACLCGSFTQPCSIIYAQESAAADGILESDAGTGPQARTADTVSGSAIRNDSMEPETAVENSTGTEDENGGESAGGEYTDSIGVVFKYRTDSGEADIYQISGCPGKDVSIPGEIDGFPVTRLTAEMGNISVSSLTIPETVVYVAENAFHYTQIGTLYYNAADAADIEGTGAYGPFGYAKIGDFQMGTGVKAIPGKMFAGAVFQQESILLDVQEIRDAAFYSAEFKEVTIGENVAAISGGTFRYAKMEKLNYNAASAQTDKTDGYVQAAFFNAEVGELEIGGGVEKLPYGFMAGAKVSQDSLTIPDSVTSIESYAFFAGMSPGNMSFGTLTIGKNAERLGDYIFGNCRIGRCVINLLKAPSGMTSYVDSQPECGSLVSHNLGTYFNYFKAKTDKENITVLCKDFKTDRWPEYYNEEKGCFAQMVAVSCTECGHTEHSYEYSDAFTVVFADHDGTELSRQHLHPGEDAAAPEEEPEREGWKFTGWDKDFTNVSENLTVTAQYEAVRYTVIFKCGDEVISSQEVTHGGAAKAPDAPKLEGHKFTGWDADFSNITGDLTVTAQYKAESYAVLFFDGTKEISRQYVDYGCAAKAPEDPVHEGMQFTGWDRDFSRITEETAVFAKFAKTSHTVTFMDGEKELCRRAAAHGGDAEPPENPVRPDEAWGRWVFTGWDGTYQNVTKDETVYARFEKSLNQYKVIFYDAYGKSISTQTVEYGGKAEAPEAPEKAADAQHTYIFKGWDADTENITADTAFHPVYESRDIGGDSGSAKTYTVTFMDGNTVIDVQKVEAGKDASVPQNPSRPGEAWGKWIFTGWKGRYKNVAADETVYACFEKKLNKYKAVFL